MIDFVDMRITELLCSRLCHEFASPKGHDEGFLSSVTSKATVERRGVRCRRGARCRIRCCACLGIAGCGRRAFYDRVRNNLNQARVHL